MVHIVASTITRSVTFHWYPGVSCFAGSEKGRGSISCIVIRTLGLLDHRLGVTASQCPVVGPSQSVGLLDPLHWEQVNALDALLCHLVNHSLPSITVLPLFAHFWR